MRPSKSNDANLALLDGLIDNWEDETVEFKEASNDFDTGKIGKYVSALSNEANLGGCEAGWLVFGVRNSTRSVVGTDYRQEPARLNALKKQVSDGTEPSLTFRSIRVVDHPDGRVVIFEIPHYSRKQASSPISPYGMEANYDDGTSRVDRRSGARARPSAPAPQRARGVLPARAPLARRLIGNCRAPFESATAR